MIESLDYAQPLFMEDRAVHEVAGKFVWALAGLFVVIGVAEQIVFAKLRLSWMNPARIIFLMFAAVGLCIPLAARFVRAIVIIEPSTLHLRLMFLGVRLWVRQVAREDIIGVQRSDDGWPVTSILKFGIGETLFMTQRRVVRVKIRGSNTLVLGSARPDEMRDALSQMLAR